LRSVLLRPRQRLLQIDGQGLLSIQLPKSRKYKPTRELDLQS
jgi:hypothetical protein